MRKVVKGGSKSRRSTRYKPKTKTHRSSAAKGGTYTVLVMEVPGKQEVVCVAPLGRFRELVRAWREGKFKTLQEMVVECLKHDITDEVSISREKMGDGVLAKLTYSEPFAVVVRAGNELLWFVSKRE